MTKNSVKISEGIRALTRQPYEIMSGTVVAGSVDEGNQTISVQPDGQEGTIDGVLLGAASVATDAIVVVPKEGSHVVIGSVDGPGNWILLKPSEITKVLVTITNTACTISENGVKMESGNTVIDVESVIKIATASESLHAILNDLITAITLITVPTPAGPSGVPVNAATFNTIVTRLSNLLSA
jgi:hypothetical protein